MATTVLLLTMNGLPESESHASLPPSTVPAHRNVSFMASFHCSEHFLEENATIPSTTWSVSEKVVPFSLVLPNPITDIESTIGFGIV